jgi:ribosomal protein S3, bacterial type
MGQKVNPHGLRVGVIKNWDSRWFARDEKFGETLVSDYRLREYLKNTLQAAGIPKIEIERDSGERVRVFIHCAKPGMVIGRGGTEIEKLRIDIERLVGKPVTVNVVEVKPVDMCAQLVAENIASQLEKRISFRRAMKTSIGRTMRLGAKGIKIAVSGRLGGAEIARSEHYHEGTIPLQTLRADIDYGFYEARTTYGKIGVKVWIYKGEVLPEVARTQTGASAVPATANANDRKPRRDRRDGGNGGFKGPRNNNNGGGYNNNNNNSNFQRRPQGQQGAPRNNNPRPEGGAQ